MIEERKKLEGIRDEFTSFVGSVVHREFVAATQKEIASIEERILEDELTSVGDFINLLGLRAQRVVLRANLTSFEDTVENLENRIKQMKLEEEKPSSTQQETEDTNEEESNESDIPPDAVPGG